MSRPYCLKGVLEGRGSRKFTEALIISFKVYPPLLLEDVLIPAGKKAIGELVPCYYGRQSRGSSGPTSAASKGYHIVVAGRQTEMIS